MWSRAQEEEVFTCGGLEAGDTIAHREGIEGGFLEKSGRRSVRGGEREVGVRRSGSLRRRKVEMLRKFQRLTSHGAEEVVVHIRTKAWAEPESGRA